MDKNTDHPADRQENNQIDNQTGKQTGDQSQNRVVNWLAASYRSQVDTWTVISSQIGQCPCCMDTHRIQTVQMQENYFLMNGTEISFTLEYEYCQLADVLWVTSEQSRRNTEAFLEAQARAEEEIPD